MSKRWTEANKERLRRDYGHVTPKQLADAMGYSIGAVFNMAQRMGLKSAMYWSKEEDDYLREHYLTDGARAVGKALGRSENAVGNRAWRIGVRRRPERQWTLPQCPQCGGLIRIPHATGLCRKCREKLPYCRVCNKSLTKGRECQECREALRNIKRLRRQDEHPALSEPMRRAKLDDLSERAARGEALFPERG